MQLKNKNSIGKRICITIFKSLKTLFKIIMFSNIWENKTELHT